MDLYSRTVLVVEDEPLIRMMLADALEDAGYRVLEAGSVLEAVGVISRSNIDALITDIDMPGGLSGLDLVRMMGSKSRTIPVIIASGGQSLGKAELPGKSLFFAKPYDVKKMIETLGTMIGGGSEAARFRIAS